MKNDELRAGYRLPLLPLRDIIVFPHMVVPLFVGRDKSLAALEEAMAGDKQLLLAAQRRAKTDDPHEDDIFEIGTVGHIIQLLRFPKGPVKVLVEGRARARIRSFAQSEPFFVCDVDDVEEPDEDGVEATALMRSVQDVFEEYVKLNTQIPPEMLVSVRTIEEPGRLADTIVAHVALKLKDKQDLLETPSPLRRLEALVELMQKFIEIRAAEKRIKSRVKKQMEKQQKEYYLNEQMQAIQKELGDRDEFKNELNELETKIKQKKMSKEAKERCLKELKKLKQMSPMSAEATVVRNYLDWVVALPWEDKTEDPHRHQRSRRHPRSTSTTASRRSKSASSNTSRCRRSCRINAARSCASSGRPASARRRSRARSRTRPVASSCGNRSAAFATKRRFAAIAARTSAHCPAS